MQIIKYTFDKHRDSLGELVAIENCKDIPFSIQRVYYMYDMESDVVRGRHAHRTLKQILICVHGSCKVKLDDGRESETVFLDKPSVGIYIPNTMWREITGFSKDAVLLVLASEPYVEADYIRDYNEFLRFVNGDKQ